MTETPPEMEIQPPRPAWWQRISVVWLVPVIALLVALGIAWNSYAGRGTLIEITFQNASGLEAGQTTLRYRDVTIGVVEKVGFAPDLRNVVASVRVANDVAEYIDAEAQFWVVRPEVSVRGISGLDTVLSGAYIAGLWDNTSSGAQYSFTGLEVPPLMSGSEMGGLSITLRLRDGNQISAGAPIIHKGIEVGSVGEPRLAPDGDLVLIDAVIDAPYDRMITSNTRFWDASGFDIRFGAGGVELDVRSLASLIQGGINFDNVISGGDPVDPGQEYDVFADETAARSSVFTSAAVDQMLPLSVVFDGSVAGLTVGAAVNYRGLTVGTVTDLGAVVEGEGDDRRVRLLANLEIGTGQLGLGEDVSIDAARDFIAKLVTEDHLRARLATASLFTGSLMVELVEVPEAADAELDLSGEPFPLLPTTDAAITEFQTTAQGVIDRIGGLPIEGLMQSAIGALNSVQQLAGNPETQRVPTEAANLLSAARALVESDEVSGIVADLRETTAGLSNLTKQIEQGQAVANLMSAIDRANRALEGAADVPQITGQLRELAEKANRMEVDQLAASAESLLRSADALIDSPEARQVPGALAGALREVDAMLAELREGGAVGNVNSALAAAESAATDLGSAAQGLPDLAARAARVLDQAGATVSGYGNDSRFNVELVTALRSLQEAADALTTLARTIQRNPNSIILGR